ncbi:hypothetical protein AB4Y96_08740 [Phyllobacterium sp. TAF24]|uniref:hypothetical protein n=1 Tax=Phyllobacterium sp. TAF24 TaxID=3233068 RepID=UPI003F9AFBE3
MENNNDSLILDLVEWVAREPRQYADAMDAWKTSCPRLTIWEDAIDRGFIDRSPSHSRTTQIVVTASGKQFLAANHRLQAH